MPRKALSQGAADGLCGLYALLNFAVGKDQFKGRLGREKAFYALLLAAEKAAVLDAGHITGSENGGFLAEELQRIFGFFAKSTKFPFKAILLDDAKPHIDDFDLKSVVRFATSKGGAAVIPVRNGRHWVLGYSVRGDVVRVRDSATVGPKDKIERSSILQDGVLLVPTSFKVAKQL